MQKFFNWMLAAILICGTSVVTTSCGDDKDEIPEPELTPNTYEVTLSAVLPESAAAFFTLDLEYTDAEGKKATVTVKAGDQTDPMIEAMKPQYNKEKKFLISTMDLNSEEAKVFDKLIIKNIKFNVPAGKSFSYKGTVKARNDYAQPAGETFDIMAPFVYLSSKRISGDETDYSVFTEDIKISVSAGVESDHVSDLIRIYDGKVVANDSRTMK